MKTMLSHKLTKRPKPACARPGGDHISNRTRLHKDIAQASDVADVACFFGMEAMLNGVT